MFTALELKAPPLAVDALCARAMAGIDRLWPQSRFTVPHSGTVAAIVALTGGASAALGITAFRRVRTAVNPLAPNDASVLVTDGIFRVTRNPMYPGLLLTLAGWALHLSNLAGWAGPVAFVADMNRFQIAPEQRAQARRFGAAFDEYRGWVRRWL